MVLAGGSKLGPYEILAPLGAGGMGEVYKARDGRLGREVAIKVLPAERLSDEKTRRRFLREARAASSLNHPNIVTIHEVEAAEGIDFLVMEYVVGATLKDLLTRGKFSVAEAVRIGVRIADALARAHGAGIVHCDLKPANVIVGPDGVVKVLDFGLARLVAADGDGRGGNSETTEDARPTGSHPGIAGTVGYMSPEQATGKPLDARSDVFSFGVTLYEMVTGKRAFAGDSTAEVLAAVVRDDPKPPSELLATVPRELDRLIQRCLRKEPLRRFQTMIDVRLELEQIEEDSRSSRPGFVPIRLPLARRGWLLAAVAAAAVALSGLALWQLRGRRPAPPSAPPRLVTLLSLGGAGGDGPSFSPDGEQIAFSWTGERSVKLMAPSAWAALPWNIYITMPGSPEVRQVTTGTSGDCCASWSPDGRQIAFNRNSGGVSTLHLVSPLGGPVRQLNDVEVGGTASWSADGRWLAVVRPWPFGYTAKDAGELVLVPLDGGAPRSLVTASPGGWNDMPEFSRDGRQIAFVACLPSEPNVPACEIRVLSLGPDLVPVGSPRTITPRRQQIRSLAWGADDAEILYVPNYGNGHAMRVGVDGRHPAERIELIGSGVGSVAIARSRTRLAFVRPRLNDDIYRFVPGQEPEPLAGATSFREGVSSISPDGRRIAFESSRTGNPEIWISNADGTSPMQLAQGLGSWQGSPRWSPDGERVAFDLQGDDGHQDIWTVAVKGGAPRRLTTNPGDEATPTWSQDGRYVYFSSQREGAREVWRIPTDGGPEERVTHHGAGFHPRESIDGRSLYFVREEKLYEHSLATGAERQLPTACLHGGIFDVAADGIYYPECDESMKPRLHRLDPKTGRDTVLGVADGLAFSMAVSRDGRTILFTKITGFGNDLMMIDNFR
jgi:eukaryotic-like serine/threonine-protein kinase